MTDEFMIGTCLEAVDAIVRILEALLDGASGAVAARYDNIADLLELLCCKRHDCFAVVFECEG